MLWYFNFFGLFSKSTELSWQFCKSDELHKFLNTS
ncbi:hypothetical protein [Sulfolobus tengchongensis spindle-shaped virus 3]|nr:hypothetical protein [Sulfolobus tengchongensis spindle-shaped virus 3]